ncbi:hypothetical protein [Sphingobacterium suaedae]|uniref:Reverse transcriptase domain-containing protein n=1 Tax=Sphingobacterium suaedae TaxID=1686402 RepID=A0ABW5KKT0_9SPHI
MVKERLERIVEGIFHPDSYGYRPGKSAPVCGAGSGIGSSTLTSRDSSTTSPRAADEGRQETLHGWLDATVHRTVAESTAPQG